MLAALPAGGDPPRRASGFAGLALSFLHSGVTLVPQFPHVLAPPWPAVPAGRPPGLADDMLPRPPCDSRRARAIAGPRARGAGDETGIASRSAPQEDVDGEGPGAPRRRTGPRRERTERAEKVKRAIRFGEGRLGALRRGQGRGPARKRCRARTALRTRAACVRSIDAPIAEQASAAGGPGAREARLGKAERLRGTNRRPPKLGAIPGANNATGGVSVPSRRAPGRFCESQAHRAPNGPTGRRQHACD